MLIDSRPVKLTTRTGVEVRRTLPHRALKMIGAWCFVDHFGPTEQTDGMVVADRALALDASLPDAWGGRGAILKDMGQVEEAIQAFERCQATGGDASLCSFFLASLRGQGAPSAPPAGYIASLVDHCIQAYFPHLAGAPEPRS